MQYFYWDPNPNLWVIPYLNHPVRWYGVLFVSGFVLSYYLMQRFLRDKLDGPEASQQAECLTDRLTLYVMGGAVLGARLGHVFFYEWAHFADNPWSVFKVWEGGLASHGGALGVIVALLLFRWRIASTHPSLGMLTLLDGCALCTGLVGGLIRLGNFVNQEITGYPTTLPWGVIFGHPVEGGPPTPRHPVQLYESLFYFLTFVALYWLWRKRGADLPKGRLLGLLFLAIFTFRFFIEFLKLPQTAGFETATLDMGQWLSLPFIAVGAVLLYCSSKHLNFTLSS